MRTVPIQLLTWGTITTAVGSAVWLSSTNPNPVLCSVSYRATSHAIGLDLPDEPARVGPTAAPGSSASPRGTSVM